MYKRQEDTSVLNAFAVADHWIGRGVNSLCATLLKTGLINQDFSSLRSVFRDRGGKTIFGTGTATRGDFVKDALEDLFICPLLHLGDRPAHLDRILVNVICGADMGMAKINEVMTQVTKRFGSREDIVFGAVIDESRSQSLELCILAKAEMDSLVAPKPIEVSRVSETITTGLGLETEISLDKKAPRPVHRSKLSKKEQAAIDQDEFSFIDADEQRGYFEKTDRNDYKDEDLDVPTFTRRGIKIKIK